MLMTSLPRSCSDISGMLASLVRWRRAEQPRKFLELCRSEIGHGPVGRARIAPSDTIVTIDHGFSRDDLRDAAAGHRREADQMQTVAIDQGRHRRVGNDVQTAADQ